VSGLATPIERLRAAQPQTSLKRRLARALFWFVAGAVLIATYRWCDVDPVGLWRSRGNAMDYLFGRSLTDGDMADIRAEASRAPEYMAQGEAERRVAEKYAGVAEGEKPPPFELFAESTALKKQILAEMPTAEREEMVQHEVARLKSDRRGGYFPPETSPTRLGQYGKALLETMAIAIWGSVLAVLSAIPLALLTARNTLALLAPGESRAMGGVRAGVVFLMRRFLDSCRGFNEYVMALILVAIIGLGPFAGILALWIHTTGILGKVFSEAIEAIDPNQVEALASTGARPLQAIAFAVVPQVMPAFVSYSLLRFESNVRSATVLGFVGAGGIGFLLTDKIRGYCFREVCTMMILVIATVAIIDFFCGKLRARFI
jgi:phosphonate transport system permease protein